MTKTQKQLLIVVLVLLVLWWLSRRKLREQVSSSVNYDLPGAGSQDPTGETGA